METRLLKAFEFPSHQSLPVALRLVGAVLPRIVAGIRIAPGYLPGESASHGCIRMPYWNARQFYDAARIGDTGGGKTLTKPLARASPAPKPPVMRTAKADALGDLAVNNFIDMRKRTASSKHFIETLRLGYRKPKLQCMSTDLAQTACDRYEIADTMHRYAFGLDHGDADSLASAFAEDCVLDFRPAGRKLGIDFPKLTGRQTIVDALLPFLGPLDTSHTASNLQIEISGDAATLHAYVMSQHFMPREGSRRGSENALLMNRYDCELVRDGQKWRFKRVTIDNAWAQGDPEILNVRAIHRALTTKPRQPK